MDKIITELRKTARNKLYACVFMALGIWMLCESGDGTVLVFLSLMGVPLFFAKDPWI